MNDNVCVQDEVIKDIYVRRQVGIERYGTTLRPWNGRSALRDAYEESVDQTMYLKQLLLEEGETQHSIAAWRQSTFGDADASALAWKVLAEMYELEDCLDRAYHCDDDPQWARTEEDVLREAADVMITLYGWAAYLGFDLHQAINAKMAINRARQWNVLPGGIGQHVE